MEQNTTYKLSYWNGPTASALKPVLPQDSLTVGDGTMTDKTIHKLSYLGNWCVKRDPVFERKSPLRTAKQWIGSSPIQDDTTHKKDFTWKSIPISKPRKLSNNLYCPRAAMSGDTTYKLSYYGSNYRIPVKSFKPKITKEYKKNDVPFERYTTYRLSYWPNNSDQVRKPFDANKTTENILNANCTFGDNATYKSSERAKINPQWISKEPIENVTTHKHDFTCKCDKSNYTYTRPKDNLGFSSLPLECCTTHKLSYWPHDIINLVKDKPCKLKIDHKDPLDQCVVPMEEETTMSQSKSWSKNSEYHPSSPLNDENTTYHSSYTPPGTVEHLDYNESCPPMSDDTCEDLYNNNPLSQSSTSTDTQYYDASYGAM
ncbi:hypothetical protein PV327_010490 [Microctonus hyperodae]|nr:hypothetical protein PV327_010490 [Microctonus hyperodae]